MADQLPTQFSTWRDLFMENALDAVIGMDENNIIIDWNRRAEEIFGWKKTEVISKTLADIVIPPKFREPHRAGLERFLKTGVGPILNKRIEVSALRKDGSSFPVELTVIPLKLEGNYKFYSFLRDLTEQKKQASEIEREKYRFQAIVDQTIVGVAQVKLDGSFALVNDRYCEMVGRSRDELIGKMKMQEITHPEDLPSNKELIKRLLVTGESFRIEKRYTRPDGSSIWVNNSVSLVKDINGSPEYLVAMSLDVSDRKKEEERRERESARNQFLAEVSVALSSSLDYQETIKKVTGLAIPFLGDWCYIHLQNARGEIELADLSARDPRMQKLLNEFVALIQPNSGENAIATTLRNKRPLLRNHLNDEYYQRVAKNEQHLELFRKVHPKSVMVVPLISRNNLLGSITAAFASERDYEQQDLHLLEEVGRRAALAIDNARLYSESKEAVRIRDEFLSIASHELKTPITSLKLQGQLARRKSSKGLMSAESWDDLLANLDRHIDRLTRLIDDMLDISRLQHGKLKLDPQETNLAEVLSDLKARVQEEVNTANSSLDLSLEGNLKGNWDQLRLEQVFINLITNALKYAPGKAIQVRALDQGDSVLVSIRDEGKGIAKENLQKIFERFERVTSPSISGLGLGLYISRQIIEAHQGKIWAESENDQGTTFFVQLPRLTH